MSPIPLAAEWNTYRFDDMAFEVKDRVAVPRESGFNRYVGLAHLDSGSLKINRWGSTDEVEKQKILFKTGDIIFGRRNAYLRRVALADFDGVCSAHAMVLRAKSEVVLPDFLPFFMQTETFWQAALRNSAGSLSPTINWSNIKKEEFLLPPIEEQRRIAEMMQAVEKVSHTLLATNKAIQMAFSSVLYDAVSEKGNAYKYMKWVDKPLGEIADITKLAGFEYTEHVKYKEGGEIIAIRPLNIKNGELVLDDIQTIDKATSDKLPRSKVHAGDILMTYIGLVGELILINEEDRFHLAPNIASIRSKGEIDPRLLEILLRGSHVQRQIKSLTTATTLSSLTMGRLRSLSIRFPYQNDDQLRLYEDLDRLRSGSREIHERKFAIDKLKRSLLSNAFSYS